MAFNEPKVVEGTLTEGEAVLTGTVALSKVDISCKKETSTGTVKNIEGGSPVEMRIEGSGGVGHYEECTARFARDTGKNKEACKVKAVTCGQGFGKITTVSMKGLTGPEHTVIAEPTVGTTISEFEIVKEAAEAGKSCALPTAKVTVAGKVSGTLPTKPLARDGRGWRYGFPRQRCSCDGYRDNRLPYTAPEHRRSLRGPDIPLGLSSVSAHPRGIRPRGFNGTESASQSPAPGCGFETNAAETEIENIAAKILTPGQLVGSLRAN